MFSGLNRRFTKGTNSALWFYVRSFANYLTPRSIRRWEMNRIMHNVEKREDYDYIIERVNYYNQLNQKHTLPTAESTTVGEFKFRKAKLYGSRYFFDAYPVVSYFRNNKRFAALFGDVIHIPKVPSIVKSRPIKGDVSNSIVLKLDSARHFNFINDNIPFNEKEDKVIFMTYIDNRVHRRRFFEMYFNSPLCILGDVSKSGIGTPWHAKRISIWEHLKYKFIITIEGNDVATNLKWAMSSNSIAVMPRPRYETWFMEGKLVGGKHYIEIADDYSDLEEKINYYINNPQKCQEIITEAHKYINQFKNKKREKIISHLVAQKYFMNVE